MKMVMYIMLALLVLSGAPLWADWNEGEPYKWLQRPDLSEYGIDICVDDTGSMGQRTIGDDFECREPGPITGVHLWGSWKNDLKGQIVAIHVQFYSDDPVGPGGSDPQNLYSKPDQLLWARWFDASQITERLYHTLPPQQFEWWWDPRSGLLLPDGDTQVWQYNINIQDEPFFQEGTPTAPIIYWLVIEVKIDKTIDNSSFGWKTRDREDGQFMDKAVWMGAQWVDIEYPPGHPYGPEDPVDMAFVLTTKEEPHDWLDFGDAPEGGMAYPSLGVMGQFPTCITIGPPGNFIQHSNFGAFFGPSVDFEPDGNAGACPGCFPPYDQDECFQDGDAGLIIPGSFTIDNMLNVVPCTGSPPMPLGQTCQLVHWGHQIDIHVENNMPNQATGYVNVLMDWDQNGSWGGASQCPGPGGLTTEHVLADFPIPNGFVGPLSALNPPSFAVGPNAGYVWVRFSITERPVGLDWNGSGVFEDGETEDYLLQVEREFPPEDMDFGDAPDMPYPTLLINNGARHVIVPGMHMGTYIDAEPDGQPSVLADGDDLNPPGAPNDEDGVVFLTNAHPMHEGLPVQVQITVSMDGFIDAWIDFEKNGDWTNPIEQIFTSQPVTAGVNVLSFNVPVGLGGVVGNPVTYARFRYSSTGGLSYTGRAEDGEVEDYLVLVEGELDNLGDLGDAPDSTNTIGLAMTAYPGVTANFPTVYMDATGNAPFGPKHWNARDVAYLGASVTLEVEADIGPDEDFVNNIDPANDVADLDNADDGVVGMPLHLPYCDYTAFDYVVNIVSPALNQTLYVNVWFDWNRDGDWDDVLSPVCSEKRVPEWAVQNQVITGLGPGQHTLRTPAFLCWHPIFDEEAPEEIWMRITLSEQPWTPTAGTLGDGGSGPAAGYAVGETEDYLFVPDTSCIRCADLNCDGTVNLLDLAIFASRWLATCP